MQENFNRSNIRAYFGGKKSIVPLLVLIIGIVCFFVPLSFFKFLGFVALVIALVLWVKNKFFSDFTHEDDVDKAMAYEADKAKSRALERLGIIKEQVSLIDPIATSGMAPRTITASDKIQFEQNTKGLFGKLLNRKNAKKQLMENDDDPKYFVKVGSDDKLRYTLLHNTVYYFSDSQLYIYWENVDIATGLVYESGTSEYFYKDIEAVSTSQVCDKQFAPKKKKYVRYINEYVSVILAGTRYSGAFRTYTEGSVDKKEIADQIFAMRNLIRDKKMQ